MERLDKSHWTLLAALARDGTLSAAAASLHITQSAASQRLREAERRLGIVLVVRTGKTLTLNAAGERIARAGEELSQTLAAAEADAIWIGRRRRDRLRLAVGHHDNSALTLALIRQLHVLDAALDIEVLRCGPDETERLLKRNDADAALLPAPRQTAGISAEALVADWLVGVVSCDDALASQKVLHPSDFEERHYLTYGLYPQSGWEYERFFRARNQYPADIAKIESTDLICALIAGGQGVSILPRVSVAGVAASGQLCVVPLDGPSISFRWYLVSAVQGDAGLSARLQVLSRAAALAISGLLNGD